MRVTAEMSLYPLQGQPLDKILAFIETITHDPRLEVVVNQLSTQVRGELGVVMGAITTAIERSFDGGGSQALVLKILNADLPIGDPPTLSRSSRVNADVLAAMLPPLEAAGVLFSLLYLVLAIRESLWCWPAAFLSSAITIVVMFGVSLYSEAALNLFYAAMAVYGWYQWRYGGRGQGAPALPISVWPLKTHLLAIGGSVIASAVVGWFMSRHTAAAFPYLDAFVTVSSVVTTYMVARKILENWLYWLVVDSLSLYLCWQRELYLFVGLFALYLVLVVIGLVRWHRDWRAQPVAA